MDLNNATITINFGPFTPTTSNTYCIQDSFSWTNLTAPMINGNTVTFTGVNLLQNKFFIVDLGNLTMPSAGEYQFTISVNGNPEGYWKLTTTAIN